MPGDNEIKVEIIGPTELSGPSGRIKIIESVPTQIDSGQYNPPGTEMITIPYNPHVFKVDELTVSDEKHNRVVLNDVTALISHGVRVNHRWQFLNGQDVEETVSAYDEYARQNNLPPIEFLIVCNEDNSELKDIRVGEFDADRNLAYAVGDPVHILQGGNSRVDSDGKYT